MGRNITTQNRVSPGDLATWYISYWITHLSWTLRFPEEFKEEESRNITGVCLQQESLIDGLRQKLSALEYLNLAGENDTFKLQTFLRYCCNLEELRLKWRNINPTSFNTEHVNGDYSFPRLHSLVLDHERHDSFWIYFTSQLLSSCKTNALKILWISERTGFLDDHFTLDHIQALSCALHKDDLLQVISSKCIKYLDFRDFTDTEDIHFLNLDLYNSSLTHISWGQGPLSHYLPIDLKHLYVDSEYCRHKWKPIAAIKFNTMPNLICLSVPLCAFTGNLEVGYKNQCTSTVNMQGTHFLEEFALHTSNLRSLEIRVCNRFFHHRCALWARIDSTEITNHDDFPTMHHDEMVVNPAQLTIAPPLNE